MEVWTKNKDNTLAGSKHENSHLVAQNARNDMRMSWLSVLNRDSQSIRTAIIYIGFTKQIILFKSCHTNKTAGIHEIRHRSTFSKGTVSSSFQTISVSAWCKSELSCFAFDLIRCEKCGRNRGRHVPIRGPGCRWRGLVIFLSVQKQTRARELWKLYRHQRESTESHLLTKTCIIQETKCNNIPHRLGTYGWENYCRVPWTVPVNLSKSFEARKGRTLVEELTTFFTSSS